MSTKQEDSTMKGHFWGMIAVGSVLAFVPLVASGNSINDAKTVAALERLLASIMTDTGALWREDSLAPHDWRWL
jgi:hypothetical protein